VFFIFFIVPLAQTKKLTQLAHTIWLIFLNHLIFCILIIKNIYDKNNIGLLNAILSVFRGSLSLAKKKKEQAHA